jgi:hypothetical protein
VQSSRNTSEDLYPGDRAPVRLLGRTGVLAPAVRQSALYRMGLRPSARQTRHFRKTFFSYPQGKPAVGATFGGKTFVRTGVRGVRKAMPNIDER